MEGAVTLENGSGSVTVDFQDTTTPDSTRPFSSTMSNVDEETFVKDQAVSAESNGSSVLSSPAEAHPLKPAGTPHIITDGTNHTATATSNMSSALGTANRAATGLIDVLSMAPSLTTLPLHTFGCPDEEKDFPSEVIQNNVTVTLECNSVWKQFHSHGTEMILTKQGRRMFPHCRYRLSGLEPERLYRLFLSIYPSDTYKYHWNWYSTKWETQGPAQNQCGQTQAFFHPNKSLKGSEWMSSPVSFYKLKLSNHFQPQENRIPLNSLHRYIPRLHVIPVIDEQPEMPIVLGAGMTFIFPQTEFMAVTCYHNSKITQLKIEHNPFARGSKKLLNGVNGETGHLPKKGVPEVLHENKSNEKIAEQSTKAHPVSAPPVQQTRLVLKPFMSTACGKDELFVSCLRGKHALGELILVEEQSVDEISDNAPTSKLPPDRETLASSVCPSSSTSPTGSSPGKGRKRKSNTIKGEPREALITGSSPVNGNHTGISQAELDDVEGHVFVSFNSKEALEVHLKNKPAQSAAPTAASVPVYHQKTIKAEFVSESAEDVIANMEAVLLRDLKTLRHRQVIHPVLQKVGLKLSIINRNVSIDLQYLGVDLPLPPAPMKVQSLSLDKELPFISRTGKTSDVTKIKGWKHKFIKSKETSANGLPKNLSAFCSDMLDEYLENEAKKISERAEAFSSHPEASVAYELPAKSSSYVKTLDSVLKNHCKASNKPCPLSYKSHIPTACSTPSSETYSLQSTQEPKSSHLQPDFSVGVAENKALQSSGVSDLLQRSFQDQEIDGEKSSLSYTMTQRKAFRPLANSKVQVILSQIEIENLSMGLRKNVVTSDRLKMALSTIVSKEMVYSKTQKYVRNVRSRVQEPECGQEFCIMGCVCSSLQHQHKSSAPLHCRQPECMLGCHCLKGQQLSAEQGNLQLPAISIYRKIERAPVHTNRLWIKNINDVESEPLCVPKSSKNILNASQQIQEKDKDPVYKYLESKMTCARVRPFNSQPPPEVTLEPKITDTARNDSVTVQPETRTDSVPNSHTPKTSPTNAAETDFTALEKNARKQIQIQSQCKWDKDKTAILKVLGLRLCENKLTGPFLFGPYNINPISKIFLRTPSNSIVTYKVQINKPSETIKGGDKVVEKTQNEEISEKEVTPFLTGVLAAGILRARKKTPALQANELIEVNNKLYNKANLLLGRMGALHPANRLAAFVAGRLNFASFMKSRAAKTEQQHGSPATVNTDVTDCVVRTASRTKKTSDVMKKVQPSAASHSACGIQSSDATSQLSPCHGAGINPDQNQRGSVRPQQSSQKSLPFLLTVSDSLKTPNFLNQSGTYSFRICPPSNQTSAGQNQSGITLPGGFTLLELPRQGACEAPKLHEAVNTTSTDAETADRSKPLEQSSHNLADNADSLDTNCLGMDSLIGDEDVQSGGSPEPNSSLRMSSDESDDLNVDVMSGDEGSDISDYSEEDDDEKMANSDSADIASQETLSSFLMEEPQNSNDFRPSLSPHLNRTLQLKMLHRLKRRNLQRCFDELQAVIGLTAQTSRVVVLERAARAINHLDQTCSFLEKKKEWLMDMNALYVKQLSFLSGKPEVLILDKINEICGKQELEERKKEGTPFSPKLLQSRVSNSESEFEPSPSPESNLFKPPWETISDAAAEQKLRQMRASFKADQQKYQETAKKFASFWEKKPSLTGGSTPDSNSTANLAAPKVNSTQMSPAVPLQPLSLPLVRSKAGRIILPSFMKPAGSTVLRIQLVQSQGDAETQPSNVPAKKQENCSSSEISCKSEDLAPSNSEVKASRPAVPIITFDQSVLMKALETVQNKEKGITANACSKSPGGLTINKLNSVNKKKKNVDGDTPKRLVKIEHSPKPVTAAPGQPGVVKRGRGRPRKYPRTSDAGPPPRKSAAPLPKDDRPVKLYYQPKASEMANGASNASRPLTRGALGKDFPSTKKRSWIDIEKELELDLD